MSTSARNEGSTIGVEAIQSDESRSDRGADHERPINILMRLNLSAYETTGTCTCVTPPDTLTVQVQVLPTAEIERI
jgi:hypothetical protein